MQRDGEGDWKEDSHIVSAFARNITACTTIADILKSTLGPSGMDKLLVDNKGNMLVTNDGATILRHLKIEQPAGVLLVELAMAQASANDFLNLMYFQDENVGDGTTSVVLLAAELLKKALEFKKMGLHPLWITKGYRKASEIALSTISEISIQIPTKDRDQWLLYIARTCLSSKVEIKYNFFVEFSDFGYF
jgi:chaperonin GroEL (HSP60 family)